MRAGLVAFAAGDALGVPWEGRSPREIRRDAVLALPQREGWPAGATSDDTAQLLLACEVLASGEEDGVARAFLHRLAAALPGIRGSGPSTGAAVARFEADGTTVAAGGTTNGALMRAPAVGWALADRVQRRTVALALARATHSAGAAHAAWVVAELAAWAVEGRPLHHAVRDHGEAWSPPFRGVPYGARETLSALLAILHRHDDPTDAMIAAVRLGGDTDTLAALAGGILGSRRPQAVARIPWLDRVALPEATTLDRLAHAVAARRAAGAP